MNATATEFAQQKYVVLRSLLEPARLESAYRHTLRLVRACKWDHDTVVPEAPALYAEPIMEQLLLDLLPRMEEATGLCLHPTYSYLRVYPKGAVLPKHRDRPACEISVSMSLGYDADTPWPLCIRTRSGVHRISLRAGEALLYRGTECPHWRDAFDGEVSAQAMFHYVDQHGPHAGWKFDKRDCLGIINIPALSQP